MAKIIATSTPTSSFMSVEKDTSIILSAMLKNRRLLRLLEYTTRDALTRAEDISEEKAVGMIGKQIKLVPKIKVDNEALVYIVLTFDNFSTNNTNPQFRDNMINFDIICHFDQWELEDLELRPYRIAAELDTMFNGKHLSGIGLLEFVSCTQVILTDEYAGLSLMFRAVHGGEDKNFNKDGRNLIDPQRAEDYVKDYNELYNNPEWTLG